MTKSPSRPRGKAAVKAAPGKAKARSLARSFADGSGEILRRIADALERLAPPAPPALDFDSADAFVWYAEDHRLAPVRRVNRVEMSLLKGIDRVRDLLIENTMTLPVQINGRKRADITVPREAGKADIEAAVLALDAVKRALDGKAPKKVIIVPQRIVNVVA